MKQLTTRNAKIAGIAIVIAIFSFGYHWGKRSARTEAMPMRFLVTGDSMAPTFGDKEICQVIAARASLRVGDVIAIEWEGKRRVKRVAALGGDTVDLAEGRLLVNGRRLEDLIADRSDDGFVAPAPVHVSSSREDWGRTSALADWLVYTHHNPHRDRQVTPVMDDYPMNQSVRRVLNPVDRLVIKMRLVDPLQSPGDVSEFQVVFFAGEHLYRTTTRNAMARLSPSQRVETVGLGDQSKVASSLDASHPIAIQIDPKDDRQYQLHVYREIEYRDDKPSGEVNYPVTLGENAVFVVGDNVPISIDSRHVGPLNRAAIIGRVVKSQPDED